jgi:SRSO17 transposase
MVERAIAAGVPFAWVVGDSIYGVSEVEMALRRTGKGYVLGVNSNSQFNSWGAKPPVAGTAAAIAGALDSFAWHRLSGGAGAKGERLFDWAYLELADLEAAEYNQTLAGLWTRGLLIRRNIAEGELAFFATWCPAGTPVAVLVTVEGQRWAIEDGFEAAKNELGLDHNETRSWHGWHRHISLVMLAFVMLAFVMLAFAMLAAIRRQANTAAPQKSSLRMMRTSRC